MGQKKKEPKAVISFELSRMMVPRDFLENFEIAEVKELSSEWQGIPHEKSHLTPMRIERNHSDML